LGKFLVVRGNRTPQTVTKCNGSKNPPFGGFFVVNFYDLRVIIGTRD